MNETILLAEDEPALRTLFRLMLEAEGYRVLLAADGVEALTVAEEIAGSIDLLVSDVRMPRKSGPELAKLLRRRRPGVKVLFVTGLACEADLGVADGVLGKPFRAGDLKARVRELLSPDA